MRRHSREHVILCLLTLIIVNLSHAAPEGSRSVTICVAPLNNNTGLARYDALAGGFADMLTAAMSDRENIKVVERQKLRAVLKEHEISLKGLTDHKNAIKVGKLLKADRILVGGIIKPKEHLFLNVHAYEIDTSRLVTSKQIKAKPDKIIAAAYSLVNKICNDLQLKLDPIDPNNIDDNPDASLHFMKGLGFFYSANYDQAIMQFMKTVDYDPLHAKARLWTAKSFIRTNEFAHARIELRKILENSPESPHVPAAKQLLAKCRQHPDKDEGKSEN